MFHTRQVVLFYSKKCPLSRDPVRHIGYRERAQPTTATHRHTPPAAAHFKIVSKFQGSFGSRLGCPFRPPSVRYGSYSVAENFLTNAHTSVCLSFIDCIVLFDYSIIFTHFVHILTNNCCIFYVFMWRTLKFLSNTFSNTPSKNVQT